MPVASAFILQGDFPDIVARVFLLQLPDKAFCSFRWQKVFFWPFFPAVQATVFHIGHNLTA